MTVVISDRKGYIVSTDTKFAEILSYNNYYAFGMEMPGRSYNSPKYRYGYNGKEKDREGLGGGGSTYDYGFRIYNPAIAKFLSVDPLAKSFPWNSPYAYAEGSPIAFIDLDGLEKALPKVSYTPSAAKLKKAAADGVQNALNKRGGSHGSASAACNYGVQGAFFSYTGKKNVFSVSEGGSVFSLASGKRENGTAQANDIGRMLGNGGIKGFQKLAVDATTEEGKNYLKSLADNGYIVIGAYNSATTGGGGHVVMFVPGELGKGKSWQGGGAMPQVMDTGKNSRSDQTPLTTVSGQTTVKAMNFYLYTGDVENGGGVVEEKTDPSGGTNSSNKEDSDSGIWNWFDNLFDDFKSEPADTIPAKTEG